MSGAGIVLVAIIMIICMGIWLAVFYARQKKAAQNQSEAEVSEKKLPADGDS